jgi:hypothetical protein
MLAFMIVVIVIVTVICVIIVMVMVMPFNFKVVGFRTVIRSVCHYEHCLSDCFLFVFRIWRIVFITGYDE